MVQRLPVTLRISGPSVNWRSHPDTEDRDARWRNTGTGDDWHNNEPRLLARLLADGNRIQFGMTRPVLDTQPRLIAWLTLAALLGFTALAYLRVRWLLWPLDDIRAGALRFGSGEFAMPIAVRHKDKPDELGELAGTINTMGSDIQQMLDAKRALLLAISHELRSPLTRARLNTELLPETADVQPGRNALLRDLGAMRELIADLLESERLASPHVSLHRERVDLPALALMVIESLLGGSSVTTEIGTDVPALSLDSTRIRVLLRNLLDNALRHSVEAERPPVLSLHKRDDGVRISVRDYGPGVPEQQLAHLAEPFYCGDAARERSTGGVGLGLYLCKLIAIAHGGTFAVRNAQPGLEITVTFPEEFTTLG